MKKVQPFRPWFEQVWPRSKIAPNPLKVCMHGYLLNGYLNSLSNFTYKEVEKMASLRPLLEQPWIMTKIILNILKVGVHCYLPKAKINLRSNFNYEKFVKSETLLLGFGLKELKITLWSNFNYKKLLKSETSSCVFTRLGLKYGQNSLEHFKKCKLLGLCLTKYEQIWILRNCSKVKLCRVVSLWLGLKEVKIIARDIGKFGVDDCLSNGHPNL